MSKAWKSFETEVANAFHGRRNVRVSYGESTCDVIHPTLALECKYGEQVPGYLCVAFPICLHLGDKLYVVSPLDFMLDLAVRPVVKRIEAKFLTNGLKQAGDYPENAGKVPVLCVKRPRMRGFVLAFEVGVYSEALIIEALKASPIQRSEDESDIQGRIKKV